MPIQRLTKEQLPVFIYIMDRVFEGVDSEKDRLQVRRAVESCADEYLERPDVEKSVYRVTKLWELLQRTSLEKKEYAIPSPESVELFITYLNNGSFLFFDDFARSKKLVIDEYYSTHKPLPKIVEILFPYRPKKIELLEGRIAQLEDLLVELKDNTLKAFVGEVAEGRLEGILSQEGTGDLKSAFEAFIEEQIAKSENKLKRASFLYRILGGFGLWFVTTPQFEDLKTNVFNAFADDYEDDLDSTDHGEEPDDFLDAAL